MTRRGNKTYANDCQLFLLTEQEMTPTPRLEIIEPSAPSGPSIKDLMKKGASRFTRDEAKILAAGFHLVKYNRAEKSVHKICTNPMLGWYLFGISKTYAEAERRVKELLVNPLCIEVSGDGTATGHVSNHRLSAAGFQFYRSEGIIRGHGTPRIKIGPNWTTLEKFGTDKQCKKAWDVLMEGDLKALQG